MANFCFDARPLTSIFIDFINSGLPGLRFILTAFIRLPLKTIIRLLEPEAVGSFVSVANDCERDVVIGAIWLRMPRRFVRKSVSNAYPFGFG